MMRSSIEKSPKGLTVRGVAGTYVVLLAFDCPKNYRKGLLGFGIERKDHENGEVSWLRGLKRFDLPASDDGEDVTTRKHPVQKFHWGDYTTKPGRTYTYTVHAFKGRPAALEDFESVAVEVTCEVPERVGKNGHSVHFNRSAAASQAFARRFPNIPKGDVVDPAARIWLSRGLAEALIAYIDAALPGEGLHLFLYEFAKEEYFEALERAMKRGVKLEILFDAIIKTAKGKKTGPSIESKPLIKKFGLDKVARGRDPSGINISHNKYMVLTGKDGKPKSVWTGSTNFTHSGVFAQTNIGHVIVGPEPAQSYLDWHQAIFNDPTMSATESRKLCMELTSVPTKKLSGATLVLSPRKTIEAVTECAKLVSEAKRMVCFTAPFALHKDLEAALVKAPSQVFGLLNKNSVVSQKLHKAKNTQLAAAGAINEKSILEVWQKKLQEESMQHSGVFIHTKIIMLDPLSDNPLIITGSANFSNNSSKNNDENQIFIAGETEVADIYLGEYMRMFDHYYFRDVVKALAKTKKQDPKAAFLDETDEWTERFFDDGDRQALRLAFFP
jgi:phosphatidylserine/phosphatidylglycerophosphate/cardiolipin synthase-like enzyme